MHNEGNLSKMKTALKDENVSYQLPLSHEGKVDLIDMTPLLGKKISLISRDIYHCVHCGIESKKSYGNGYCFKCFSTLAECDMCIVKPETCHYDQGTCRDPRWGEKHCMQEHYVYLANSSGLKVGITRAGQIPTRWMDQGAVEALTLVKVQTRFISGLIEVELAKHMSDKTNWRQMLTEGDVDLDLVREKKKYLKLIAEFIDMYGAEVTEDQVVKLQYPIISYPKKITSLSFEKTPRVEGVLQGIKGQYLILDSGVINIRKYNGLKIQFEAKA